MKIYTSEAINNKLHSIKHNLFFRYQKLSFQTTVCDIFLIRCNSYDMFIIINYIYLLFCEASGFWKIKLKITFLDRIFVKYETND